MTIDELAQRTGMTVRNIRAHQSRGLVPPPEVRGRTGYYGDDHVGRVELIQELQADGFNLESIRKLLDTAGGSSAEVLNFSRTLRAPFEDEQPEILTEEEFAERWGPLDPRLMARTEKLGLLRDLGDGRYEILSPRLQRAGLELAELGVPRASRSTWSHRCGAARGGSRACSSNSSLRTSGSRSTRRAGRRTTGRRCATPSSGCGRWRPRRCS